MWFLQREPTQEVSSTTSKSKLLSLVRVSQALDFGDMERCSVIHVDPRCINLRTVDSMDGCRRDMCYQRSQDLLVRLTPAIECREVDGK